MEIPKGRNTPGKRGSKDKDLKGRYGRHLRRAQRPKGMEVGGEAKGVGEGGERM